MIIECCQHNIEINKINNFDKTTIYGILFYQNSLDFFT